MAKKKTTQVVEVYMESEKDPTKILCKKYSNIYLPSIGEDFNAIGGLSGDAYPAKIKRITHVPDEGTVEVEVISEEDFDEAFTDDLMENGWTWERPAGG